MKGWGKIAIDPSHMPNDQAKSKGFKDLWIKAANTNAVM